MPAGAAATIAVKPHAAPSTSALEGPVFSGMPFTPVTSISPDIAWMTVSKAARPGYSESAPKPEIEQ